MSQRIAFMTFGVLKKPVGHEVVQGFVDRIASVYAAADGSVGFFARSVRDVQTWQHSWGPVVAPLCAPPGVGLDQLAMTLSLWQDLESVAAYAYQGVHAEAMSKRSAWFERGPWPSYVAWWVEKDHQPTWPEGVWRLDQLHANGARPDAFTFRQPFDSEGRPTSLKRTRSAKPV